MLAFLHQFIFPMELFLAILIYVLPLRIRKGGGWRCLLTGLVLLIVEAVWIKQELEKQQQQNLLVNS